MSLNLLDMAKSSLAPVLASKAGALFGLDGDVANKALDSIVPTLLSGVLSKSASAQGAESLLTAIKHDSIDANVATNLDATLSSESGVNTLGQQGGQILGALFGDKADGLGEQIAQMSGAPAESATGVKGLAALAAPALFGLMKNQVVTNNLDAKGFGQMLAGQVPHLEKSLPAQLAEFLGWGSVAGFLGGVASKFADTLGSVGAAVTGTVGSVGSAVAGAAGSLGTAVAGTVGSAGAVAGAVGAGAVGLATGAAGAATGAAVSGGKSILNFFKWLLPLIVVAAVVLMLMKYCSEPKAVMKAPEMPVVTAPAVPAVTAPAVPAVPFNADAAITDAKSKYLAALKALETSGKCDAAALSNALGLYIVNFKSGSAALPAADVVELTKAVPVMKLCAKAGVKLNVVGHTDNVGNPAGNQKLSQARAESLKALFVKEGIAGDLIAASGKGDMDPIADNKTDEGRFKNRRITYTAQ